VRRTYERTMIGRVQPLHAAAIVYPGSAQPGARRALLARPPSRIPAAYQLR
jgi:hypothetical protein